MNYSAETIKAARILSLALLCFVVCTARAAGYSGIEVPADKEGPALRGAIWTPCAVSPLAAAKGASESSSATTSCAVEGDHLPLVIISHGSGGSFLGHRDTAEALADAGFVVASISHPGDNFRDLSRQQHLSNFGTRPVDIRRLVDFMLYKWGGRSTLDPHRVGVFGFSRGGYTGLVAVGAVPNFALRKGECTHMAASTMCDEFERGELPPPPRRDPRIRAAVIADPGNIFDVVGLRGVTVPVQLWASEYGGDGVTPASVEALREALPKPPEWHAATGASHFAFLAPCSPALAKELPDLCRDRPGFDRIQFHQQFNAEVIAFFRAHLTPP